MKRWLLLLPLLSQTLFATVKREEVPKEHKWNTEYLFATPDEWHEKLKLFVVADSVPHFPELVQYKGTLGKGPEQLYKSITSYYNLERQLTKFFLYAQMRHHEDMANPDCKAAFNKICRTCQYFSEEASWIQPELLALPDDKLQAYISHPLLADYKIALQQTAKAKPHIRSKDEETLISLASSALQSSSKAFSALDDADLKFGTILDSEGTAHELTHASYNLYLSSPDRTLRKNAFQALLSAYRAHENTLTELYAGTIKSHMFLAKTHNYSSTLEASLKPNDIDLSVYHSLISAVRSRVDLLHHYASLRKKILQVDELHLYDLTVPLVTDQSRRYSFEEARKLVLQSVQPLGKEYAEALVEGLTDKGWVDRHENQNKHSGAYSTGCYDSLPYMLLNYNGTLRDVFTLAHESGHSMHRLLSRNNQPYHYAEHAIFVAEVASLHNEALLHRMLLERAQNAKERAYLLTQKLDDIIGALYRQTLLAEFELFAHTLEENGSGLTPKVLKDKYLELLRDYFGPELVLDPEAAIGWARIPHLHRPFYVYQYATGISAALCLSDKVLSGSQDARDSYLRFLQSGSSDTPLNLLAIAGCDMRTPKAVNDALDQFASLVYELEMLLNTIQQKEDSSVCANG